MIVDFGSCLHDQPTARDTAAIERRLRDAPGPGIRVPVPDGFAVQLGGEAWVAQSGARDAVAVGLEPGHLLFRARSGERASFDPARKIRAELCGARRYGPGEPIFLRGVLRIEADAALGDTDWCSLVQIHQADTRRADGRFVDAAPIFGLSLKADAAGTARLMVTGATGRGVPQPGQFFSGQTFADVPFAFGRDHPFEILVIDGHGRPGRVRVRLDESVIVDRSDVAVGYDYVDLLAEAGGSRQSAGSYLKMGVYAGRFAGDAPPSGFAVDLSFRDLSTEIPPARP